MSCIHCRNNELPKYDGISHEFVIVNDDTPSLMYNDSDLGWEGIEINFCPWCGEKLVNIERNFSMELKDTVELMLSDNYKDRLEAEYIQTKIRYVKLVMALFNIESLDIDDKMKELMNRQKDAMSDYLNILRERANLDGIDLMKYNF